MLSVGIRNQRIHMINLSFPLKILDKKVMENAVEYECYMLLLMILIV